MSKQEKKGLVPALRFPEFQGKDGWELKKIGDVFDVTRGYVLSMNLVNQQCSQEAPYPVYSSQTKNNGLAGYYHEYLYENAITWTTDGANAGDVNFRSGKFYCTNVCGVLLNDKGFANPCVAQLLNTVTRSHVSYVGNPKLMNGVMSKIEIPFPELAEQQKIADCLTSVDELITAQTQKLDTLKTHKKGLMQQLFPAEGETVPKLRFPELRDKGEWSLEPLETLIDVVDGDRGTNYPKADEFNESGYCLFLNAKNVTKEGFKFEVMQFITKEKDEALRKGKLKRKDVVLTTRGSIGQFAYYSDDVSYDHMRINSGMVILRVKSKEILPDYLYIFSKSAPLTIHIENVAFGNAQQQLTVTGIKKFPLCYPEPEEQQKIADCLTSVDELIAAQTQKLAALKAHKKGLMQQLFPAMDSVGA